MGHAIQRSHSQRLQAEAREGGQDCSQWACLWASVITIYHETAPGAPPPRGRQTSESRASLCEATFNIATQGHVRLGTARPTLLPYHIWHIPHYVTWAPWWPCRSPALLVVVVVTSSSIGIWG